MAPTIIEDDQVSSENLRQLFEDADLTSEIDDDGDLIVSSDSGPVVVFILQETRRIRFFTSLKLQGYSKKRLLDLVSKLNSEYPLCRSRLSEHMAHVIIDYEITFLEAVFAIHIIHQFKTFSLIVSRIKDQEKAYFDI